MPVPMFELDVDGGVATLRICRPAVRNAIPIEGWAKLAGLVEEAEGRGATSLLLTGTRQGAFCAGADLADFPAFASDPPARSRFREEMRSGLERLARLSIPTIAWIEGACYGAGVALAMACDLRLAHAGARFGITPAKLGISYPQQDVHRLVGLIGPGQAARLLFSAATIDGAEAHRIGLVDLLAEAEEMEGMVAALAAMPPESIRTLKRGIRLAGAGVSRDEEQDRVFDELLGGRTLAERLAVHRGPRR